MTACESPYSVAKLGQFSFFPQSLQSRKRSAPVCIFFRSHTWGGKMRKLIKTAQTHESNKKIVSNQENCSFQAVTLSDSNLEIN